MAIPAPGTRCFGILRAPIRRSVQRCISLGALLGALLPTKAAEDTPSQSFALDSGINGPEATVFSEDLKWIATKLPSGKVKVWNVETGASVAEWQAGEKQKVSRDGLPIRGTEVAFLRPGPRLMVAARTNVGIHDLVTGKIESRLDPSPREVTGLAVSLTGNRAVGLTHPLPVELFFWNVADGKHLSGLPTKRVGLQPPYGEAPRSGRNPPIPKWIASGFSRAFSPDGERLAVGLEYGQIDVWDLGTGRFITTVRPPGPSLARSVTRLAFLGDQRLAGVIDHEELSVFDLSTGTNAVWIRPPPPTGLSGLEIRALAVSGDGQRLAIAGMRMGKRPGVFAPAGDVVFDVPMHGEVQVWDTGGTKAAVTFKGKPNEKFGNVALDQSGHRVAAVTTGVNYTPGMSGAMQQNAEMGPTLPLRVSVWNVPTR